MTPEVKRQIWQSLGQFAVVLVSGMLVFKDLRDIAQFGGFANAMYQPVLQAALSALGIWGISKVGAK